MSTLLLVIHLFVTLVLIGLVLLQRSEGGGLGIGSSQGMGAFMSGRGTANLLTRATAVCGTLFMVLSLALALLGRGGMGTHSILDSPAPASSSTAPASTAPASTAPVSPSPATPVPASPAPASPAPATPAPASPATPAQPAVPAH